MDGQGLTVQLNIDAITAVAVRSARATADVVTLALELVQDAGPDAVGKAQSRHVGYDFGVPDGSPEERLQARRRWLLTKGFQDITLAIRHALEEADLLLAIASAPERKTTPAEFNAHLAALRRSASQARLPALLARIEAAAGSPLKYGQQIRSLNRVRNCFEHRRGIVTAIDCDPGADRLTLSFPRTRIFYVHEGQEVELGFPHKMPETADGADIPLLQQTVLRELEFPIGATVDLDASAFAEVTFAVWFFAHDLKESVLKSAVMQGLPRVDVGTPAGSSDSVEGSDYPRQTNTP